MTDVPTTLDLSADQKRAMAELERLGVEVSQTGAVAEFEELRALQARMFTYSDLHWIVKQGSPDPFKCLKVLFYEGIVEYRTLARLGAHKRLALERRVAELESTAATIEGLKKHIIRLSARIRKLEPKPRGRSKATGRVVRKINPRGR